MTEKRAITKEDILLKTRLMSEGARFKVKGALQWGVGDPFVGPIIIFDDRDMVAETRLNPRSRLELTVDGSSVVVSEMGDVLGTATLEPRAPWRDKLMSDGTIVDSAWSGSMTANYINVSNRCDTFESGLGCRFCHPGALFGGPRLSLNETLQMVARQIEATVIAIQSGWRGLVLFIGGAMPTWRRGQWTTDLFEGIMNRFKESLDGDLLSQLDFQPSVYPPDDLGRLYDWKRIGITSAGFDIQVFDPDYFKALCPGRGDQKHWFEAQEAAVDVFGPYEGSVTNVVTGIEPMTGLLKGFEERTSKGVRVQPVVFYRGEGSAMAGMQPASAEWYVEAFEKMNRIRMRYGLDTVDGPIAQTEWAL